MYFKLMLLFLDDTRKTIVVKRVSNLSNKSKFFYYEEPYDERGKGTKIDKSSIKCFEFCLNI